MTRLHLTDFGTPVSFSLTTDISPRIASVSNLAPVPLFHIRTLHSIIALLNFLSGACARDGILLVF